jgi:hypothetical protein
MSTIAFVPFVRRGLATGITRQEGQDAPQASATFAVNAHFALTHTNGQADARQAVAQVALISPGDIVNLHGSSVVRLTPGRDESDAEFEHFATVELDQPDLPWRYTPVAANGDRLKPWLVLLVLSETDTEFDLAAGTPGQSLPKLTVHANTRLPDVANESWAWAHVQFHGTLPSTNADVEKLLRTDPSRAVARLFCARILEARKAYHAFVVPAFSHGVQAGLGQEIDANDVMTPAWTLNADGTIDGALDLPVYYDWRFQTGPLGNFESIVRSLVPSPVPQDIATRDLDVSVPGYNLPSAVRATLPDGSPATALPIGGALQPLPPLTPPNPPPPAPPAVSTDFITGLKAFMEASGRADVSSELLVVPPLYGRWQAAQSKLDAPGQTSNPPWFFQLNSDPRNRVAASLGTNVVHARQQELMASAWRQLGSLREANVERRTLQVGRESFVRLYERHITTGPSETFLLMTGLLHGRVAGGAGTTVHALTDGSRVGRHLFDPQWRRFARRRGKIGRRQGRLATDPNWTPLTRLNDPTFDPAPEPPTPDGMASDAFVYGDLVPANMPSIDGLFGLGSSTLLFWGIMLFCISRRFLAANAGVNWWWMLRVMRFGLGLIRLANGRAGIDLGRTLQNGALTPGQIAQAPGAPGFTAVADDQEGAGLPQTLQLVPAGTAGDSPDATNFRNAFGDQVGETGATRLPIPVLQPITIDGVGGLFAILQAALHPSVTLKASIGKRLTLPANFGPADPLEPIQAAPEFPQPVWSELRDQSSDWILPGLDRIGANTVGLCVPNQPFIEAFMVGLNHEMSRELLWNEYPTDQRGTYFRQFWDVRGNLPAAAGSRESIVHIHAWGRSNLGENAPASADPESMLVLLVRGDVIRRYPNVVVYTAEVENGEPKAGTELFPFFTGRLGGDIAFYGFVLDLATAQGNPGRYFILQEQPAEPRFDPPLPITDPGGYVSAAALASSAAFASDRYQPPTRVAILASTLTPPQG